MTTQTTSTTTAPTIDPPATGKDEVPVGLLMVGRARPGFDPQWGEQVARAARRCTEALPWPVVESSAPATDEPSMQQALDELRAAGCRSLVLLQPTMGDGRLLPTLIQRWPEPIVLWATTERQDSDRVSACTLVGTHACASQLAQAGHGFEIVNGHPDEPETAPALERALRLTRTATRLRTARVGLVGTHAPGFLNMRADADLLHHTLGAVMHHIGVQELIDASAGIDADRVRNDRAQVDAMNLRQESTIPDAALEHNSRYALAIADLFESLRLDGLAVRCWPELPNVVGAWPYVAFSRLGDAGYPLAMEGDLDGAVTLLIGQAMGFGPGYLSDWLEHDHDRLTLWHQGEAPMSWCDPQSIALDHHFNNNKPVVVNSELAADRPITLARLWHCGGRYHLMAVDGRTVPAPRPLKGTTGGVVLEDGRDVPTWFDGLCHAGMPHHVALFAGHRTEALRRLARLLNVQWSDPR